MDYRYLGASGIKVSRLCFGSLTIGPMQSNLSLDEGVNVIITAFDNGVNFIDTAKLYGTYPFIKKAIYEIGRENMVISSRSYDYTYEGMKETIEDALTQMNTDYIDVFGLHEQESLLTLRGHKDAIAYLIDAKKQGKIRAISVSTHNIEVVNAICRMPEIDIVHPIVNIKGIGIGDGRIEAMLDAVHKAKSNEKGIYSMKPIGGGNLINDVKSCLEFVINNNDIDSIAVGMQSADEVIANICMFNNVEIPESVRQKLRNTKRRLLIDTWCEGCGKCVERCTANALSIKNGKCQVNQDICRLCGYCSTVCPEFCIKII